jgi:hypothetical protein
MKYPKVEVCWKDHFHASPGAWIGLSEVSKLTPCEVVTTGYLIHKDKEVIVLAQNITESGDASGVFVIIRSCITKLRKLHQTRKH